MQVLSSFFPATVGLEPMPDYPPGRQCNRKGLTKLGAYLRPADDRPPHADRGRPHERAGARAGADDRRSPPLPARLEPHRHRRQLDRRRASRPLPHRRLRLGDARPGPRPAPKILRFRHFRDRGRYFGVGLGTDTGGFSSLPGPAGPAEPGRLPVPRLPQRCRVPAPANRRAPLRPERPTASPTTASSPTCWTRSSSQPDGRAAMRNAVPLRRGLPADVGANRAQRLTDAAARHERTATGGPPRRAPGAGTVRPARPAGSRSRPRRRPRFR